MRLKPIASAKALTWTVGIIYSFHALLVIYYPDLLMAIAQTWYPHLNPNLYPVPQITIESFVTGLIISMLSSWIIGYLLAGFYNYFNQNLYLDRRSSILKYK